MGITLVYFTAPVIAEQVNIVTENILNTSINTEVCTQLIFTTSSVGIFGYCC